jgi:hypothetical protein
MIGDVNTVGALKYAGKGTGLQAHEVPSAAAQKLNFIKEYRAATGRIPSISEINSAMQLNPAILIPKETHVETDTYAGKNNSRKIPDSNNLEAAAKRGVQDVIDAGKRTGIDVTKSARALEEIQRKESEQK